MLCLALQVSDFTVTMPGGGPVDGTTMQIDVQVFDIDESALQVVEPNVTGLAPAVDMSKVVDTQPPVIALTGSAYTAVLQTEAYLDAGATASDNIDGNTVPVQTRLQLCTWQDWMLTATDSDSGRSLTCTNTAVPAMDTLLPTAPSDSGSSQVYVYTYTARDMAGNQAALVRRFVSVTARCA